MLHANVIMKYIRHKWILVSAIAIIILLLTVIFIELDSSVSGKWISDSFRYVKFHEEYDLLLMTAVEDNKTDIDLLKNWTSLFTSERVRLLFFIQSYNIKLWKDEFPDVDIIAMNREMIMCHKYSRLNLKIVFETAKDIYNSRFYGYVNQNVLISHDILTTTSDLINNYREIDQRESTLIIARSMLVKDKNVALQLLNTQSNLSSSQFKYSFSDMSDVFITNRQFEWFNIPSLIAHEASTSQLLTAISRQKRVVLLDVTKSLKVIRPQLATIKPSRYVLRCVKNMIIESEIASNTLETCGKIVCIGFETIWRTGQTTIRSRPIPGDCSECSYDSIETDWIPK